MAASLPGPAERHIAKAFDLWEHRNGIRWKLDLSVIADAGITVRSPASQGRPEADSMARRGSVTRRHRGRPA